MISVFRMSGHLLNDFFLLIGGKLLYNVVLVSALQLHESVIITHISPSWVSLLSLNDFFIQIIFTDKEDRQPQTTKT